MRRLPGVFLACAALVGSQAGAQVSPQVQDHVRWKLETVSVAAPGSKFTAKLTAAIDSGWHLYSLTTPQPGPIATTLKMRDAAQTLAAYRVFQPKPEVKFDPNFNRDTETYFDSAVFLIAIELKKDIPAGPLALIAQPRYQVCSSTSCIPPVTRDASASVAIQTGAAADQIQPVPAGYAEVRNPAGKRTVIAAGVIPHAAAPPQGAWAFLLTAFGFGLAAIFTPCVFPMMPITVSYFLNAQSGERTSRAASLKQALLFCAGIVVLFSALGLIATSILGPFGVVQLGSNPWVNGLIALVFIVFGLSLLGAYEITIPSFVLSKLDSASRGGGTVGTLLMGLTFSLASFACVGPFVGTLLAASVTEGGWRPAAGMATFASGLALPFFLLALFPSYLKKLPKSGGWLGRVKVVMGFIIMAAALKYLASVDQVLRWGFLTRERFLAAWVVLFVMAGLYLLGFVRLEGVKQDEPLGLGRLFAGMAMVIFALTLVPGMLGGRLGELEGFVPPPVSGSTLGGAAGTQLAWIENDFNGAIAKARAEHKRVLVNFTGYACTNCHWMKQNMFTKPEVASILGSLVLVDLYTDADDAQSQANQQLEQTQFHTIAIPFYVLYDPGAENAKPMEAATFPGLTRDVNQYIAFLNTAPSAPLETAPASPSLQTSAASTASAKSEAAQTLNLPGVKTLNGAALDATALAGKVVVANFWATWCVPCRAEIPEFNDLQSSEGSAGVQVLGISLDEDGAEAITPFVAKHPMNYPIELASEDVKTAYKLDQLPVTVIFDRNGRVTGRFEGRTSAATIRDAVRKVL